MPSTITSFGDVADQILLVAADALEMTDSGAPSRQYVSPTNPPTFDCCPFLTVAAESLTEEATSPLAPSGASGGRDKYGAINLVTFSVWSIRCAVPWDGNSAPTPTELAASASEVLQDGWALWNGFRAAIRSEEIFERCGIKRLQGGFPVTEQGGCVGWRFLVQSQLDGIPAS